MARPRFDWLATLRHGDRVVAAHRVRGGGRLWIGEGGDLVVPGIAGRVALVAGAQVQAVEGLRGASAPATSWAQDAEVVFTVEAHPEITVTLERPPRRRPAELRARSGRGPWAELVYGTAAVGSIAALLVVATAEDDERRLKDQEQEQEPDERSAIELAMLDLPTITFVAPPPPVVVAEPEGGRDEPPVQAEPAPPEALEQPTQTEAPPPAAVVEPEAPPKASRARRRGRKEREGSEAYAALLGTHEGNALMDAIVDDESVGVLGILSAESPTVLEDGVMGGVVGGVIGAGVVDHVPTATLDAEPLPEPIAGGIAAGIAAAPEPASGSRLLAGRPRPRPRTDCERVPSPLPQVDVVFVVDVSGDMVDGIASISAQISTVDEEARQYDAHPRYGLVAFVDEVELVGGRQGFSDAAALQRALDELLVRAGTDRQPDGSRANDEPEDAGLDALHAAASRFAWRDAEDTLRLVVYASDSEAAGSGTVLSGRAVEHGYAAVLGAFTDRSIRVASFTAKAASAGFASRRGSRPALPEATGGSAFALSDLVDARPSLQDALAPVLANPVCRDPDASGD